MKNCIVILNLSNFTGTLNHGLELQTGMYKKLRADYKKMLQYIVNDRNLLGAFVLSQKDLSAKMALNQTKKEENEKFLQTLKRFGWTPITLEYYGNELTSQKLLDSLWEATNPLLVEDNEWKYDPSDVDIIFINGSVSWYDVIVAYYNAQFSVEVSFLSTATNKHLKSDFPFLDITDFLIQSTDEIEQKKQQKIKTKSNSNGVVNQCN